MNKITMIELFSGIGSQKRAMDKTNFECEIIATSEIDKYAILSYATIHCDLLQIMRGGMNTLADSQWLMSLQF